VNKDKIERREKLIAQLKDKRYRDAFVAEHIATGIPFQIRALRKQKEWKQRELADHAGMLQERISVAENPNYAKFNIQTLKKIASAFDVALIVRFVPFSELLRWELNISSETLAPASFDEDQYFKPRSVTVPGQSGILLRGEGMVRVGISNLINSAGQSISAQPFKPKPVDELSKYREAKQKEKNKGFESQLAKLMKAEKDNEAAFG
jgi:transcriptional regulator with XRE-family HTH domain